MDILTKEELKRLTGDTDGIRISIYLPTHRAGKETQQGAIRLKNLLRKAEEMQPESGLRPPEFRALLEPAQKLVADARYWQSQSDGLAVFLSDQGIRSYRLPISFDEQAVVGRRFHIKPLLPLFAADGHYFILAISQKEVRLLQSSRYSVSAVDIPSVPENIDGALQFDDIGRQLQFHTRTSPSVGEGRRQAMFHGHGAGVDDDKSNLLRYFYQIDKGLQEVLRDEHAPMVLAGVGYLFPIYREANTYPNLLDEGVEGNPEELSAAELQRRSWEIVQPHFTQEQREAMEKYRQLLNIKNSQASDDLEKVVPAAFNGQVDTLFVALNAHRWGTFDARSMEVELHREPEAGDDDLVDFAAVQTFLNGGNVYALKPGSMPGKHSLAAILRY